MISPADFVGLPAKVIWLIALFSNTAGQPTTCGVGAKAFDVHKSKAD